MQQLLDDVAELRHFDEVTGVIETVGTAALRLLREPDLRDDFVKLDVTVLRREF